MGPESQHPDCNNGSFKHQEKRQTQIEAQGEQNRVRERTRNRGRHTERQREGCGRESYWGERDGVAREGFSQVVITEKRDECRSGASYGKTAFQGVGIARTKVLW